jgi:hypothetical protein
VNVTDESRVEASQRQLTEQVEAIQSGENWQQVLHCAARGDCSARRDTAIEAGGREVAIGA